MLNKKRLKIKLDKYKSLVANGFGIPKSLSKKNDTNLYSLRDVYGELYLYGMVDAIEYIDPWNRNSFQRQRDYERYMNGYNNGKHLRRYLHN